MFASNYKAAIRHATCIPKRIPTWWNAAPQAPKNFFQKSQRILVTRCGNEGIIIRVSCNKEAKPGLLTNRDAVFVNVAKMASRVVSHSNLIVPK